MAVPTIAATATTGEANYNSTDWGISLTGLGTISAGDLLLAVVGFSVGGDRNWSAPSGWTRVGYYGASVGTEIYVFAKAAAGGETVATVAKGSANGGGSACLYRITGWYGTVANGVEVTANFYGGDDPGNLAPTWGTSEDHLWLVGLVGAYGRTVSAYPANYTSNQLLYAGQVDTCVATAAAYTNKAASSSENPGAFTTNVSGNFCATIGVRPAAGGATAKPAYYYAQL